MQRKPVLHTVADSDGLTEDQKCPSCGNLLGFCYRWCRPVDYDGQVASDLADQREREDEATAECHGWDL